MKIAVTSIQQIENEFNGVASHVRDLRASLESMGHSVRMITPYHEPDRWTPWFSRARRLLCKLGAAGPHASITYLFILNVIGLEVCRKLKRMMDNLDVINAHDVITAESALKAARGRIPVVLTCHFWAEPWREFTSAGFVRSESFSRRLLERRISKTLKNNNLHFICPSVRNKKLLAGIIDDGVETRTRVIYHGVASMSDGDCRQLIPAHTDFILNVGKLEKRKNQRILVSIAAELKKMGKPYVFVLMGPEDGKERAFLNRRIGEKRLAESFIFLGEQNRSVVYAIMKTAAVYFHTSVMESFGMTLVESLCAGTPVVGMEYKAIHEILPGMPEAVISADTPPEVIAGILSGLIEDKSRRENLALKQERVFQDRFTLKGMASNIVSCYRELAEKE